MADDPASHLRPDEAGTESRDAQSAWIGGGRTQPYLSAERFADANEGSRHAHHPLAWAAAWFGAVILVVAAIILFVK